MEDAAEVLSPTKDENSRLCITPSEVSEELVNGLKKQLATAPYLALSNEDVPITISDEDVRFACPVECLTCGPAFIVPVQHKQKEITYFFLTKFDESTWAAFHHQGHAVHDLEYVLVLYFFNCRLRRKGRGHPL